MRNLALAVGLLVLPALVHAENFWRWQGEDGTLHYSNIAEGIPGDAKVVDTRITLEVDRLPGAAQEPALQPVLEIVDGTVVDADRRQLRGQPVRAERSFDPLPDAPRVYSDERKRFGCFSAGILYFGGFSHAGDISPILNCYPYVLGPEAWLNTAKAELAIRENGINPRNMVKMYREQAGVQP